MAVLMSPVDAMFVGLEAPRRPMNIGAVGLLSPPAGSDAGRIRDAFTAALARNRVAPLWRRSLSRSVSSLGQWSWRLDADVDLGYHVQFDALPRPAGLAELWRLVARLHSRTLDRGRPLWRLHLIEGLADGRYAFYIKVHHAFTDGVAALRLLRRGFTADPSRRGMPAPWELCGSDPREYRPSRPIVRAAGLGAAARGAVTAVADAAGAVPALADAGWRALRGRSGPLTLAAPSTPFNGPIDSVRSVTGRVLAVERLRRIAEQADATVNDVVLAVCAGALRRYLAAREALPDKPLIAMVPVSLRTGRSSDPTDSAPGNKIGVLMCSLATHLSDPTARLSAVQAAMRDGKAALAGRTPAQTLAMAALGAAPVGLAMVIGGGFGPLRPANVMVSNIPGAAGPLYWNGAGLAELYPLSVPVDGQALNITCTRVDGGVMFGLSACRRAVPAIDTLGDFLGAELDLLDVARISHARRARRQPAVASAGQPVQTRSPGRS